jgi:hypothetical protein
LFDRVIQCIGSVEHGVEYLKRVSMRVFARHPTMEMCEDFRRYLEETRKEVKADVHSVGSVIVTEYQFYVENESIQETLDWCQSFKVRLDAEILSWQLSYFDCQDLYKL